MSDASRGTNDVGSRDGGDVGSRDGGDGGSRDCGDVDSRDGGDLGVESPVTDRGPRTLVAAVDTWTAGTRRAGRLVGRAVAGDRYGVVLWLAAVVCYGLAWRVGVGQLLTDTNAIANTLVAVADGRVAVAPANDPAALRFPLDTLGADTVQQGLYERDGTLYGRNYGQVAATLPLLWLLQGLTAVADLRAVLAGGWSLAVLALAVRAGRLLEREWLAARVGAVVAVVALGWNLLRAAPLDPRLLPVVALQLGTLLAAATIAVLCYRIVGAFHGRRVGLAVGVATAFASPVAFWATVPKRHVPVATLVFGAACCLAAARWRSSPTTDGDDGPASELLPWCGSRPSTGGGAPADGDHGDRRTLALRAGAVGLAALVTWIHVYEGLAVLFVVLGVDLLTARETDGRGAATLLVAAFAGLVPTLLTNVAVTGSPVGPVRPFPSLAVYLPGLAPVAGVTSSAASWPLVVPASPSLSPQAVVSGPPLAAIGPSFVGDLIGYVLAGWLDFGRLWHVLVRSGRVPGVAYRNVGYRIAELSVLESAPLLGALAGTVPAALGVARRRLASDVRDRSILHPSAVRAWITDGWTPERTIDCFAVLVAVAYGSMYLGRLPVHAQFTVRYLFPVFVLGLYGVARLAPVRRAVARCPAHLAASFATTALLATIAGTVAIRALSLATGEAVQLHALVALATALVLGAGTVAVDVAARLDAADRERRLEGALATLLGVAGGLATALYALFAFGYVRYGTYALAMARELADTLPPL